MGMRMAVMLSGVVLGIESGALFAQPAQAPLAPAARFGCIDCDGPLLFAGIAQLAWLPDGRILVLSAEAPFVRLFAMDGTPDVAFGRAGSGPGELRTPMAAAALDDGAIDVIDLRLLRITRFDSQGSVLATRSLPPVVFPVDAVHAGAQRGWVIASTDWRRPTPIVVRIAAGAQSVDTLAALPADFPRTREGRPSIFADLAVAGDGTVAAGDGVHEYRILRFASDGRRLADFARAIERSRRTPAELAREQARRDRMSARAQAMRQAEGGGPGPMPPAPAEHNHFDADALVYDERGRLWVRTPRGGDAATVFDVFAPDGTLLGEVRLHGRVRAYHVGARGLLGVILDEDDVPSVGVWPRSDGLEPR